MEIVKVDRYRRNLKGEREKVRTDLLTFKAPIGTPKNCKRHGQTKIKHVWHDGSQWRSRVVHGHNAKWNSSATASLYEYLQ
jgi:hypothetical protein